MFNESLTRKILSGSGKLSPKMIAQTGLSNSDFYEFIEATTPARLDALYLLHTTATFGVDGYDVDGFNRKGFDANGFDAKGFNRNGFDANGFDVNGLNWRGIDANGVYACPFNVYALFGSNGIDHNGLDREGFHSDGFNVNGFNRKGFDRQGLDWKGSSLPEED